MIAAADDIVLVIIQLFMKYDTNVCMVCFNEDAINSTPAGRFCKPEEIAMAALFLSGDGSNMITGANLMVDGGYTIH